jgi:hypothetical protein
MTRLDVQPRGAVWWLAVVLLAGTGLLGIGAILHPMLPGQVPGQLDVIARTPHWRAIHLVMIVGSVLVVAGMWSRVLVARLPMRRVLTVIMLLIAAGVTLNALNIAFMAEIGTGDAARYVGGDASAAAVFAQRHDASLSFARTGNLLVALGCVGLGVVEGSDPMRPRWVALLALVAGIGGMIGVIAFDPASRGGVAAVGLFTVWAAASAALVLRRRLD